MKPITIRTTVNAPVAHAWACFTSPEHIIRWNFASDDWAAILENYRRYTANFK